MAISLEEVNRIAKLARLSFNEAETKKLQHELSDILNYIDQLKQISAKGGSLPAGQAGASGGDPDAMNLMREDVAEVRESPEVFLKQSPAREGNFVKVKSVLE